MALARYGYSVGAPTSVPAPAPAPVAEWPVPGMDVVLVSAMAALPPRGARAGEAEEVPAAGPLGPAKRGWEVLVWWAPMGPPW